MSYESMAALSDDEAFRDRVLSCCSEQALVFKDDGREDIAAFARAVISSPNNALPLFELVCVSPNFRDVTNSAQAPDADILAAVQANWPTYAAIAYPAPPPSP
jgi:hypothetical protein